jgi:hypothetical protein
MTGKAFERCLKFCRPEMILAGRCVNDGMGAHVADRVARLMMRVSAGRQ